MKVVASARDAAVHIFAVVPEIQQEARLCAAPLTNLLIHIGTLFGGCNQISYGILPDRNIGEVPPEQTALFNHQIHKLVRSDGTQILTGIAGGEAKNNSLFSQNIHGADHCLISTGSATEICILLAAFDGEGKGKITHAL